MPRQTPFSAVLCLLTVWMFFLDFPNHTLVCAFSASSKRTRNTRPTRRTTLFYSNDDGYDDTNNNNNNANPNAAADDWQLLHQRLQRMRLEVMEQELTTRPPQAHLSATDFVQQLLACIWQHEDPTPEAGFRVLLRTATVEWKTALYQAVGAPLTAAEDVVASALGQAMGRPDNQYAILVGVSDTASNDNDTDDENDDDDQAVQEYVPTFPAEPLDYYDGTAWVECRLRDKRDNSLLVSTGWQLRRRDTDGAWMVAGIDWQDFRDKFRPGIGREEWMRICN